MCVHSILKENNGEIIILVLKTIKLNVNLNE